MGYGEYKWYATQWSPSNTIFHCVSGHRWVDQSVIPYSLTHFSLCHHNQWSLKANRAFYTLSMSSHFPRNQDKCSLQFNVDIRKTQSFTLLMNGTMSPLLYILLLLGTAIFIWFYHFLLCQVQHNRIKTELELECKM